MQIDKDMKNMKSYQEVLKMEKNDVVGRYHMTISRTTVDKLGVKLYDKVSAVIGELVANSYDADATEVTIELPLGKWLAKKMGKGEYDDLGYEIVVKDNGHGMIPDEIDDVYLKVGRERRKEPNKNSSPKYGRPVMGRKGIGKLAPFGICKEIEVISSGGDKTQNGYITANFILGYDEITEDTTEPYKPKIGKSDGTYQSSPNTTIILRNFYHRRIPEKETFHNQIARRFGIPSENWKIKIVDSTNAVHPFTIGDLFIDILEGTKREIDDTILTADGDELPIKGWVAYSKHPYKDEDMAGIRIFARGKLVARTIDFGLPTGFHGENTARSRLVGELNAEWIDLDDREDLTRTSRDDILWNTEWGYAFQEWGQELVKDVAKKGVESLSKKTWQIFLEKSKIMEVAEQRIHDPKLRKETIKVAQLLGRTISPDALEDDKFIENLRDLAITIAPNKILVETLSEIGADSESPFEAIVNLFDKARIAEMASYGQIVSRRLDAIKELEERLEKGVLERQLQSVLEEAPWIINPEWIPITHNQFLETFRTEFEKWFKTQYNEEIVTSAIKESSKKPDFILLSFENAIQVVEIKPKGHKFNKEDYDRLERYFEAMEDFWEGNAVIQGKFPEGVKFILICDKFNLPRRENDAFKHYEEKNVLTTDNWNAVITRTKYIHEEFLKIARSIEEVTPLSKENSTVNEG